MMVKICQTCGTQINDDQSQYCTKCGASLIQKSPILEPFKQSFKYSKKFIGVMVLDILTSILFGIVGIGIFFDASNPGYNQPIWLYFVIIMSVNFFLDCILLFGKDSKSNIIDERLCRTKYLFGGLGIFTVISFLYFGIVSWNMHNVRNVNEGKRLNPPKFCAECGHQIKELCSKCGSKLSFISSNVSQQISQRGNEPEKLSNKSDINTEPKVSENNDLVFFDFTSFDQINFERLSKPKQIESIKFILKYVDKNDYAFQEEIVTMYLDQKYQKKELAAFYNLNTTEGLNNKIETIRSCLKDTYKEIKSCSSIDERKKLDSLCKLWKYDIEFLQDLPKIQKILQNKGLILSISGILEICYTLIQKERFNDWTEDLTPYLTIWKERLGDNPSIESILKEITKTKFDFFKDESSTINYWGYMWVLKQFGYDCNPNEIDAGLKPILELRELDRFEKNVISPPNSDETNEDLTDLSTMGGYAFEEYMAKIFRKMGYTVDITPKSRDQGADLVIKQNNDVTVVQVKNYTSSVSNSAIQEVVAAKGYYHANKAMVVTSSFFTPSAIDLALANDVILWDCEKIKKILSDNGACI